MNSRLSVKNHIPGYDSKTGTFGGKGKTPAHPFLALRQNSMMSSYDNLSCYSGRSGISRKSNVSARSRKQPKDNVSRGGASSNDS